MRSLVLAVLLIVGMAGPAGAAPILPPLRLGQAVAAVHGGRCEAELPEIRRLSQQSDLSGARAAYLLAHCLLMGGEAQASVEAFDDVAARYAPLADHATFYAAQAAVEEDRPEAAGERLQRVIAGTQLPSLARRARLMYADVLLRLGEHERARDVVQQLLSDSLSDEASGRAWWLQGLAAEGGGDRALAIRAYHMAWWSVPEAADAGSALARLRALEPLRMPVPTAESRVERARRLVALGEFGEAERELASALHQPLAPAAAAEAWYRLGLLRLGTPGAVYAFAQAAEGGTLERARALYWQGRALLSLGRRNAAWALWREVATSHASSSWAPRAWLSLGLSAEAEDDLQGARRSLAALAQQYPSSGQGDEARWRLGWLAYRQGRYRDAERQFLQAWTDFPTTSRAAANLYWAAKARTRRGADARTLVTDVAQRYPFTFYGQRARRALGMPGPEVQPGPPAVRVRDDASAAVFEELAALGFDADAADAAGDIAEVSPDRQTLTTAAWLRARMEDYSASLAAADQAARLARAREEEPDRELWMLAYPLAYWGDVRRAAQAEAVDPFLIAAVMREESRFNARVVSPARAVGLMQLLPSTASAVAGSVMSPEALMHPDTNITLGAKFLAGLLRRFDGDPALALIAYNAGPIAARRFSRLPRADPDVFIESIPFSETRAYVQRVLQSYVIYHWLYQ